MLFTVKFGASSNSRLLCFFCNYSRAHLCDQRELSHQIDWSIAVDRSVAVNLSLFEIDLNDRNEAKTERVGFFAKERNVLNSIKYHLIYRLKAAVQ